MRMKKGGNKKFNKLRVEFLPEALEIIEKPADPLGNIIIWAVFLLLFAFLLWACLGKVDEVAVARGQVMSDDGVQEIQAAGSGIVTKVMVAEGQQVKAGDILYSMDKELEKKNIDYSEGEIGLTELRVELIDQLLNGKDIREYREGRYNQDQREVIEYMISLNESDELSVKSYETAVANAKNQYDLAVNNLGNSKDKEDYLKEQKQIQDKSQKLASTGSIELEILKSNYKFASTEAEKYQKLYEAGAVSKVQWQEKVNEADNLKKQIDIKNIEIKNEKLSKKSDASSIDYQISESQAESANQQGTIEEMKNNYDAAVLNLENAKKERDSRLYEMREQCMESLKQYGVTVTQQYYEYENKNIYAPYDGVIKVLNVDKAGAVVTATQAVAEILPDTSHLIVEAEVSNSDIGFIESGQKADIKVDTFDYQKYGMLHGSVIYISPDAIENERMEKIYKVNILLDEESAGKLELSQGMQCSVEIKTDTRHIIEFFLEPLTDALGSSLKER